MLQSVSFKFNGIDNLSGVLAVIRKSVDETKQGIDKFSGKLKEVNKFSDETKKKIGKLSAPLNKVGKSSEEAKKEVGDLCKPFDKVSKCSSRAGLLFSKFSKKIKKSSKEIGKGLRGIKTSADSFAKVGFVSSGGIGLSIKEFAGLEHQMSVVKSLSANIKDNEFKALQNEAKRLGAVTSFSSKEAAQGLEYLALAGVKPKQSLEVLETVLRTAEAGGMDLALATDIVTDSASALGEAFKDPADKVKNITKLSDMLAMAQSKSNANIQQFGEAIKYGGNSLANLGVPLPQIVAMMGKLADAGLKGSVGGTSLGAMFNHLTKQSPKTRQALNMLGIDIKKLPFDDMPKFIEEFKQKLATVKEPTTRSALAVRLFGKEGARAFLNLSNVGSKELKTLTESLENSKNAARDMAKVRMDNLVGRWKSFKSAVSGIAIEMGSIFISKKSPWLNDLIKKTQTIALAFQYVNGNLEAFGRNKSFDDLSDGQKNMIQTLRDFKEGVKEAFLVIKEKFLYFKDLFNPVLKMFGGADDSMGKLAGKFVVFAAVMAPVIVGALAIGAAFSSALLPVISLFSAFSSLGGFILLKKAILMLVTGGFAVLKRVLFSIGLKFLALLGPVGWVVAAIAGIGTAIYLVVKNWDAIKSYISDVFAYMMEKVSQFLDFLPDWAKEKLGITANISEEKKSSFEKIQTIRNDGAEKVQRNLLFRPPTQDIGRIQTNRNDGAEKVPRNFLFRPTMQSENLVNSSNLSKKIESPMPKISQGKFFDSSPKIAFKEPPKLQTRIETRESVLMSKTTQEVELKVDFNNIPRGIRVETVKTDIPIDMELGYSL